MGHFIISNGAFYYILLQKLAILLHLLGPEGQEIFDMIRDSGKTFVEALLCLDQYLLYKQNVIYGCYLFMSTQKLENAIIEAYVTCLRSIVRTCDFGNSKWSEIMSSWVSLLLDQGGVFYWSLYWLWEFWKVFPGKWKFWKIK